jgi:hypothetical protein
VWLDSRNHALIDRWRLYKIAHNRRIDMGVLAGVPSQKKSPSVLDCSYQCRFLLGKQATIIAIRSAHCRRAGPVIALRSGWRRTRALSDPSRPPGQPWDTRRLRCGVSSDRSQLRSSQHDLCHCFDLCLSRSFIRGNNGMAPASMDRRRYWHKEQSDLHYIMKAGLAIRS